MSIEQFNDEVYEALKAHIQQHMSADSRWDGVRVKWPTGGTFKKPEPPATFIVFEMSSDVYDQETIGASEQADNRWDEEGGLWLHLTVPKTVDFKHARGAAKVAADFFRGAILLEGRLEFLHTAIGIGRPDGEDGTYFVISVNVDWRVMES